MTLKRLKPGAIPLKRPALSSSQVVDVTIPLKRPRIQAATEVSQNEL
jgi:hypothetical protein